MERDELRVRDLFFVLFLFFDQYLETRYVLYLPFDKVFEFTPPYPLPHHPPTLIFGKILKCSDAPKITTLGLTTVS